MSDTPSTAPIDDRLLATAIDLFGRKGFEGVSTRAIAAVAGTAMSSITYHYGGKDGLYLAAARHIAERIGGAMAASLAGTGDAEELSAEQALRAIHAMTDGFLRLMLSPESAAWARFIVREQMEPTAAFEILYRDIMSKASGRLVGLIARIGGGRWGEEEARLKAIAIIGQVLVFRVARATVERLTGWEEIDAGRAAEIAGVVRAHCRAILLAGEGGS